MLLFVQDMVAMALFALFYFSGGTAVAVLGSKEWKTLIDVYRGDEYKRDYYLKIADRAMKVWSATIAISVSSYRMHVYSYCTCMHACMIAIYLLHACVAMIN